MPIESFFKPEGKSLLNALEFTKFGIDGAEIYTFLSVNKNNLPEGVIFCSEEHGKTAAVIYKNGDMTVTKAENTDPYPGFAIMKYAFSPPKGFEDVVILTQHDAMSVYKLLGKSKKLSPDNEKRYVYRARLMRDGFSTGFGIKKENELVSFAFITAENEDSALIGDVFTAPEYRSRGYAKKCVLSAVKKCIEINKFAYIVCDKTKVEFYRRLGFTDCCISPDNNI